MSMVCIKSSRTCLPDPCSHPRHPSPLSISAATLLPLSRVRTHIHTAMHALSSSTCTVATPRGFGSHASAATSRGRRRRVATAVMSPPAPPHSRTRRSAKQHSMPPEKVEIFRSLESWARDSILPLLKPVDKCWQPSDFLPDSALPTEQFADEVKALRERVDGLPDEYFVVLVGDMITEEALPTYQTMINTLDGVRDETGASECPWATWTRMWTAEENRHGDLLGRYLYLSGRVDMKMVEKTVQYLIGSGMDPGTENNPYLGFVYTSFQERATFISHGNTARLAKDHGDLTLARICGTVAADEKRHEVAYGSIVAKLLEIDPSGAMCAIEDMMRKKITMPAHLMHDGKDVLLFDHFSSVAQRLGVYTAGDYAGIVEFLVDKWGLEQLQGLDSAGRAAQDYVCGLGQRIRRLQERAEERAAKVEPRKVPFSWIFGKELLV